MQLAQTTVNFDGLFEDTVLPMPTWSAVDSAIGFELEIVDAGLGTNIASILFDQLSVCSGADCAAFLVEVEAADNVPPSAVIEELEIDPTQPALLKFTAENSFDSDGVIAMYRWRLDGRFIGMPTSVDFEYLIDESGTFRVGLEVTDDVGIVDLKFIQVEVSSAGIPTVTNTEGNSDGGTLGVPENQTTVPAGGNVVDVSGDLLESGVEKLVVTEPLTTGTTESWQLRGTANTVLAAGNTVFVGGEFTEIYNEAGQSLPRGNLVALNRFTGQPTSFAPNLNGRVWALALSPDEETLYVGGSFLMAEGLERPRIAAYDVQTGLIKSFATAAPNRALRAITVTEDRVYLGGLFTRVGNVDRPYVAAFDPITGELDEGFTASPDALVRSLIAGPDQLWIGGDFNTINGVLQKGVGAVDIIDGSLQSTGDVDYRVLGMTATDTQIFTVGGNEGGNASAIDRASGIIQWEISGDGKFQTADVDQGRFVYFGGHYESIEGDESIDRLTRHDKSTGITDTSWLPRVNGIRSINALDVTSDGLYIGGDFTRVGGNPHEGVAIFQGLTD